ncbi:MAG: apolipoprotein N-acyltransferase [Verrucomicrobiia bacterium]
MRSWVLPIVTGLLLSSAFPPFNVSQSAWLALVPLLFAVEGCAVGCAFRRGYVAGLVFFGATTWWTVYTTVAGTPLLLALAGTVALVALMASYFGLAAAGWAKLSAVFDDQKDSALRNLMLAILAAAGWVMVEWMRGVFPLGGFPLNFLGAALWQSAPLIQFASVTGVYGVSALVCIVNFVLYFTLRRFLRQMREPEIKQRPSWEFYVAMALVCAAFLHGWHEIQRGESREVLRLAVVQGNIPQTLKFEASQKPMILERYRVLTEAVTMNRPDLIIWPETATPDALRYDPESYAVVTTLVAKAQAPLFTGTIDADPTANGDVYYNAATLVLTDGTLQDIYHKIHLVPFGEYVPLRKVLPFMKWLTPIPDSFERGQRYTLFRVHDVSFGAVICFEDVVAGLYRQFVKSGAEFMVNVTNDAWFKTSPAAEMHLANAVFRAIENHRPLVRVTNHGVTCIVDEFGIVRERLAPFTEGAANWQLSVPRAQQQTFYTRFGDVFVAGCVLVTALGIAAALFRRRTGRHRQVEASGNVGF